MPGQRLGYIKVNVSWDSENLVSTLILFFKFISFGYICGGLNNCHGYHIVFLVLNEKAIH